MRITDEQWTMIRKVFIKSVTSSFHCAVATVKNDGSPSVTPIGSLFLDKNRKGFYFEKFLMNIPENYQPHQRVCILAVNSSKWFWLKSLFQGKFNEPPAIRIRGTLGAKRKATPAEIKKWRTMISPLRFLKGYHLLWAEMDYVREIDFDSFEPVRAGAMTQDRTNQ
ncbi:pyridoxamine 5'-phosphate oxidase family protein [candidate division CSSED10-310 bacterium]|uniref:Pyridoxamine 5'-phosphate oxidase family protein n=1 Tax=candidate division CSSED10-310 bacterium TaxID=2855610 RepID=A0ABV6YZ87_UNCC1